MRHLRYWFLAAAGHNYLGYIICCGLIKRNIRNIICDVMKNSLPKLFSGKRSESNTASCFVA